MRHAVAVIDKIRNCCMYLMCTFICRPWGPVHWDPLDMLLKPRHNQAAYVEVMELHQCKWEHKGVLGECQ